MSIMTFHEFKNSGELTELLAQRIKELLLEAIQLRGHAYLVVSGGKTPLELFKRLAQMPLAWDKVTITLADERCVEVSSADSNEHLVKNYLLKDYAQAATWIGLYDDSDNSATRLEELEQQLASLPAFDVVLLGLGEDGHTASLFPCSKELAKALEDEAPSLLSMTPKSASYSRLSLSKKRLLQSRFIFLHFTGEKKRAVLERAKVENKPMALPISAFLKAPQLEVMYAPS